VTKLSGVFVRFRAPLQLYHILTSLYRVASSAVNMLHLSFAGWLFLTVGTAAKLSSGLSDESPSAEHGQGGQPFFKGHARSLILY
jgi:hypothetical protein